MSEELTEREREIMLHTLGLDRPKVKESYRNYFVADEGHSDLPVILELCARGLMEQRQTPGFIGEKDRVYAVTDYGRIALENAGEQRAWTHKYGAPQKQVK